MFCRLVQCCSFGSSLPPILVSTLPHAFKLRNQIVDARLDDSFFAACDNLRHRVQSRQLNSGELDVTPIPLAIAMTASRSCGVESRQQGTQSTSTKPPYNIHSVGDERSLAGRASCSKFTFKVRNVQPPSYQPGHPLRISNETRITI